MIIALCTASVRDRRGLSLTDRHPSAGTYTPMCFVYLHNSGEGQPSAHILNDMMSEDGELMPRAATFSSPWTNREHHSILTHTPAPSAGVGWAFFGVVWFLTLCGIALVISAWDKLPK